MSLSGENHILLKGQSKSSDKPADLAIEAEAARNATAAVGGQLDKDNDDDPNFDRKLDLITEGCRPFVKEHLLTKISRKSCITIINYILTMQTEVNPSERYNLVSTLR